MSLTLYGIKNCDTVRKARRFLDGRGTDYRFVDFKSEPVGIETIRRWLAHIDAQTLLNRRGATYRKLGLAREKLDEAAIVEWLAKENLLIKRPVLEGPHGVTVGFDETIYKEITA